MRSKSRSIFQTRAFLTRSITDYSLPFDASWELNLGGRIQNTVKANAFEAQATAADLENTRLTVQAEVAVDYFEIRAQDELKQLLDSTGSCL